MGEAGGSQSAGGGSWGAFRARVLREMTYHRLEFQDEVIGNENISYFPEKFRILLPSTGPAKARAVSNRVFVADPQVKVEIPEGYKLDKTREEAEKPLTDYLAACIQTDERQGDSAPLVLMKANCVYYGLGSIQTTWKRDAYPKDPVRKKGEPLQGWTDDDGYHEGFNDRKAQHHAICAQTDPFDTKSLHPTQVAYDRAHRPPRWAVTIETITPWDAAEEYPYWAQNNGKSWITVGGNPVPMGNTNALTKIWYWTPEWCACYINGDPAFGPGSSKGEYKADEDGVAKNPYGFIPIDFAPGGHGDQDPDNRPEYELVGLYKGMLDLLLAEASYFTLDQVYFQAASFGNKKVIQTDDPILATTITDALNKGPHTPVVLPFGAASLSQLEQGQMPSYIIDQRRSLRENIDLASIPDVATGASSPVESGRRTDLRLVQTDKQVAQAAVNLEQALESNLRKRLLMIKRLYKKPVGRNVSPRGQKASYVSLDPDDIPNVFEVTVQLIGDTEEQKAQRQAIGMERLANGSLDMSTFLADYAQEKNPDAIIKGLYEDAARLQVIMPAFIQLLQGEGPGIMAEEAAKAGIIYTNEELQANLPPPQPPIDPNTGLPMEQVAPVQPQVNGSQPIDPNTGLPQMVRTG